MFKVGDKNIFYAWKTEGSSHASFYSKTPDPSKLTTKDAFYYSPEESAQVPLDAPRTDGYALSDGTTVTYYYGPSVAPMTKILIREEQFDVVYKNYKHYAITKNGKTYLPVRKNRKYWKEISSDITYKMLLMGLDAFTAIFLTATKGEPEVGKTVYPLIFTNGVLTGIGEDTGAYVTAISDELRTTDGIVYRKVSFSKNVNERSMCHWVISGGDVIVSGFNDEFIVQGTQIVPGTPDDYTYYEDILKYY